MINRRAKLRNAGLRFFRGSKVVLYTSQATNTNSYDDADIVAYSVASGQAKTILHGGFHAIYLPDGYLVYMHSGTLFAIPFDAKRLETTGPATAVVENVVASPDRGTAQFSISDNGTLVYVAGSAVDRNVSIYWMDADGKFTPAPRNARRLRQSCALSGWQAIGDGHQNHPKGRTSGFMIWSETLSRGSLLRVTEISGLSGRRMASASFTTHLKKESRKIFGGFDPMAAEAQPLNAKRQLPESGIVDS